MMRRHARSSLSASHPAATRLGRHPRPLATGLTLALTLAFASDARLPLPKDSARLAGLDGSAVPARLVAIARAEADEPLPDPDRRLLSSGQTEGWRGDSAERADGNGDDGDLVRGRLHEWPEGLAWPPRPGDEGDNVALDPQTGLAWIRDLAAVFPQPGGGPDAPAATFDWESARQAVAGLSYAGHSDWRLPNVHELQSLVDYGRALPAWETAAFGPGLDALGSPYFWTATTSPTMADEAYYVNFVDGHAHPWHKALAFSLRPVRDAGVLDPVLLLQTGQRRSYRGTQPVDPPGGEDDGHLRRGEEPRYRFEDDGTIDRAAENLVTDLGSGLMWLRDPLLLDGLGSGLDAAGGNVDLRRPQGWQAAVEACAALDYGGHADWRLPNVQELLSISQFGRAASPQEPAAFPNAAQGGGAVHDLDSRARWWTSTSSVRGKEGGPGQDEAWFVTALPPITRHHVNARSRPAKAFGGLVRCVRDAQPRPPPDGWRPELRADADWQALSVPSGQGGRLGKFLLAAGDRPEALPFQAAFQEASRYPLHLDFLRAAFPQDFGALDEEGYRALAGRRATRRLWAGGLRSFPDAAGRRVYGVDLYTEPGEAELPRFDEVSALCRQLGRAFRRRPLVYSPSRPEAIRQAQDWPPLPCPLTFPQPAPDPGYSAYTLGEAYGTLRLLRTEDLPQAALSWQDIVVLDQAPVDLEAVVGAIVTAAPQGELSHLAVRAARRGTPNAYLARAAEKLATGEGRLVRLTLAREGWELKTDVDPAEAQAFWDRLRPPPLGLPPPDLSRAEVFPLEDLPALPDGGLRLVGAKAANLARLGPLLPPQHRVSGLALPFRHYQRFLQDNAILDADLSPLTRSLELHLAELLAQPRFLADPAWRGQRLSRLRAAMRDGDNVVADETVDALATAIRRTFGPGRMVRLRSSSNAEDSLRFSGAGLYDSTSACVEDGEDGDSQGPSRCDPRQPQERTLRRALRRVWASLWTDAAAAERAWYGMDQGRSAMGILITPAFLDELAGGVAFTGNPLRPEAPEMVVNAQPGEASVVLPEEGAVPERDVLELAGGRVARIRREQASSLLPPGGQVLSDAQLFALGDLLLQVRQRFAVDPEGEDPARIFLDLEFKLSPEGRLVFKQVRPFLAAVAQGRAPEGFVRLELPGDAPGPGGERRPLALCSAWREAATAAEEEADLLQARLRPGELTLPLAEGELALDFWAAPLLGPDQRPAQPEGRARLALRPVAGRPELRHLSLGQAYRAAGRAISLSLELPTLRAGEPNLRRLDGALLLAQAPLLAQVDGGPPARLQPCGLPGLPAEQLRLDLGDAGRVFLTLRYGEGRGLLPYVPAALSAAWLDLRLGGEVLQRHLTRPADLTYDAARHNWDEVLRLRLDPPLGSAAILELRARGIPGRPDETWTARLLGPDGGLLRQLPVTGASRLGSRAEGGRAWLPWGGS